MADEILVQLGQGNVDVQIGGPGNNWQYLSACASMDGPTVPYGDFDTKWRQDPAVAGGFKRSSKIRTAPDLVSFNLMTKLGKVNYLKRLRCSFSTRARYAICGEREDPANYDPVMVAYCNADITEKSYDNMVVTDPGDNDEVLVTSAVSADYEYEVRKVSTGRTGSLATLGDQAINDIEYCGGQSCAGYCGAESDGCTLVFACTDADASPYAAPNLIKGLKDLVTGAITWSNSPVLGANGNLDGIECAGSRIVVSSSADSAIFYNSDPNQNQNSWIKILLTRVPAANQNALFARTTRELWLGCNGGYILKSVDAGTTWVEVHSATLTTQNINAVYAYNKDLVVAVGNNGVILLSNDGGSTWDDITETSTTAANLLCVIIPPGRPKEIYIGTNNGRIYRSTNGGDTFSQVVFDGDSVGTVDDIKFCGPCAGDVMWFIHNDAGPRGRILRDLSGGAGGPDVEVVMDYTSIISTGIGLNALACCDVSEAIVGGALLSGFPTIIKVS